MRPSGLHQCVSDSEISVDEVSTGEALSDGEEEKIVSELQILCHLLHCVVF